MLPSLAKPILCIKPIGPRPLRAEGLCLQATDPHGADQPLVVWSDAGEIWHFSFRSTFQRERERWPLGLVVSPPALRTITETNRIRFVLLGMQNRIFGPYLAANERILISVMNCLCRAPSMRSAALLAL
jgi:hypothetical protein